MKKVFNALLPLAWQVPLRLFFKQLSPAPSHLDKKVLKYLDGTKGRKKFLIVGTPEHSNIGDHAIAAAEKAFLMEHFPGIDIIEIETRNFFLIYRKLAKYRDDCIILVIGGGSLGTFYWSFEYLLHLVLKYFNRQQIVVFPQTVYWEPGHYFTERIEKYIKLYEKHPDLTVFIRDKSVDFMENTINRSKKFNVFNVPDIVLSLNKSEKKLKRNGILFCLRSDKEKVLDNSAAGKLVTEFQRKGYQTGFTDMKHITSFPIQCRDWVLENKFNEFRSAKLVVTDRLHGMIFATITGTPCIALNNSSAKVEGVYDLWLQNLPYVKFATDVDDVMEKFNDMDLDKFYSYDPSVWDKEWNKIVQVITRSME